MMKARSRTQLVPFLAISLLALAACNGTEQAGAGDGSADASAQIPGTPDGKGGYTSPTPSTPAVGESCVSSDPNKICLAIHFVSYTKDGKATATAAQASTIIHKMNQVFAQCNIGFQIQQYEQVDPVDYGLAYGSSSQNQTDTIRSTFQSPTDQLLAVTTGPWGTAVNAWTNMPGDNVYGAIMEASIVAYGDGIIYTHEFGHYLGLDHVSNSANLMNPVISPTSDDLSSSQCATAREVSQSYWSDMIRA
jgi:hypothetical protein